MDEQKLIYIAGIIAKSFREELSVEEQAELEAWKNSSPEHPEMLERFSHYSFLEAKLVAEQLSGKESAWQSFRHRQQEFRHRRRIRRWSYAAVVVVVMAVAAILFYRPSRMPANHPVMAEQFLPAGKNQAVLTLANGRKINLEKQIAAVILQDEGLSVDTAAGCIAYKPMENQPGEIRYNQLEVPRRGEYRLVLADGTKVWLNSESELKYPVAFQSNERRVYLRGEAYFEVAKNARCPFIVETEETAVQVLGTSFNVRAYTDEGRVYTTLVEGSVRLSCGRGKLMLLPDEQGIVCAATGEISKQKVNTLLYTAWKDGRFVFENQTLEDIMRTLVRWYDVNVLYTSERVKEAMFNGNLKRYDDFNRIVEMLEMTGVAHFKINGNTIVISE